MVEDSVLFELLTRKDYNSLLKFGENGIIDLRFDARSSYTDLRNGCFVVQPVVWWRFAVNEDTYIQLECSQDEYSEYAVRELDRVMKHSGEGGGIRLAPNDNGGFMTKPKSSTGQEVSRIIMNGCELVVWPLPF